MTRLEQLQQMTADELAELVLAKENESKRDGNKLSWKVAESGGISIYGVGRFPITTYAGTWMRIFEQADSIKEFIKANRDNGLKFKHAIPALGIEADEPQAK